MRIDDGFDYRDFQKFQAGKEATYGARLRNKDLLDFARWTGSGLARKGAPVEISIEARERKIRYTVTKAGNILADYVLTPNEARKLAIDLREVADEAEGRE